MLTFEQTWASLVVLFSNEWTCGCCEIVCSTILPSHQVESFVIDQEFEEDPQVEAAKFLLSPEEDRSVDPETQARLEALLQAAGK